MHIIKPSVGDGSTALTCRQGDGWHLSEFPGDVGDFGMCRVISEDPQTSLEIIWISSYLSLVWGVLYYM